MRGGDALRSASLALNSSLASAAPRRHANQLPSIVLRSASNRPASLVRSNQTRPGSAHKRAPCCPAPVPCRAVPCRAGTVPCCAVPCRAVPCHAVPRHSPFSSRSGESDGCGSVPPCLGAQCPVPTRCLVPYSQGRPAARDRLRCRGTTAPLLAASRERRQDRLSAGLGTDGATADCSPPPVRRGASPEDCHRASPASLPSSSSLSEVSLTLTGFSLLH